MAKHAYTASLSQSQGRSGYSVIFRHPTRKDDATGKPGLRVRHGLGTKDVAEAEKLRGQLDKLLAEPRFHEPAARADAERQFDARVVDIFYYKMVPEERDAAGLREKIIPLPESGPDGVRRVLLLGTTGAGKTTLVRQIIGTDPATERFPSTSTAKTTVHDTEILLDAGPWRAVATFVPSEEVREYLEECISAAVLVAAKDADDGTVLRRLLSHVNQRFRFNYVLGNGPKSKGRDFDEEDDEDSEEASSLFDAEELGEIDVAATEALLAETVLQVRKIAQRLRDNLRKDLNANGEQDERVLEEIFEEELDSLLRDEKAFHEIAYALMDEIEKRFDLLPPDGLSRTKQGWPLSWSGSWPVEQRKDFLKGVSRFSSNYAPFFGRLLTPLVNGIRMAGPFRPTWTKAETPKLVILDGEGLGHTPKSSSSMSTTVSRRIEAVDAVLLVDNATQPMQAAPLAAMREVVATGNARKLIFAFTHFDEVKGDNLRNVASKAEHVLASAENVLASLGEELGPFAERALRKRLDEARFFLAGIQEPLSEVTQAGKRTIGQMQELLGAIDKVIERPQPADGHPVYDRMNLVLVIRSAAETFHGSWLPRLGRTHRPGIGKEHWTRVKALTRRLALGRADEYDTLRPVADLRRELLERIYVYIQSPLRWEGPEPSNEERQGVYDTFADNIGKRLLTLATKRVRTERVGEWQNAYDKRGTASTFERAQIIDEQIFVPAAPVPDVIPSPDRNQFLRDVVAEVEAAAKEVKAKLI